MTTKKVKNKTDGKIMGPCIKNINSDENNSGEKEIDTDLDDSCESIYEQLEQESNSKCKNGVFKSKKRKGAPADAVENSKKQKPSKDLFKPPTVEELNRLRETENLFNSNLFRLQIVEILKELEIKQKSSKGFLDWYDKLKCYLSSLIESKEYSLSDHEHIKKVYSYTPFDYNHTDKKGIFTFIKPKSVTVAGMYNSGCAIGPLAIIEINLEIPNQYFHKSDCFNARYLYKRALYLSHICKKLLKCDFIDNMHYTTQDGNILKPIIEVIPKGRISKQIRIHLRTSVEQNSFKYSKFSPLKSNLRSNSYFSESCDLNSPTPFYNSSILEDLTFHENEFVRCESIKNCVNIKDALKLLQVWLKQRELSDGFGGFNNNLMLMFVVYLIKNRKLNNAMSSYQVIRNVWLNLENSNWHEAGIALSTSSDGIMPSIEEFHKTYSVVFIDVTGYYNLTANLNLHIYLRVKHESKLALSYLDNGHSNNFQALFTTKMPFYRQYDHILHIHDSQKLKDIFEKLPLEKKLDYLMFKWPLILNEILSLLYKGLKNRLFFITPKLLSPEIWAIDEIKSLDQCFITIGFELNPDTAFSIVDVGPEANMPNAVEFKQFWGDKAELRRFADGTISEAVVWNGNTVYDKRNICKSIVSYLLKQKFDTGFKQSTSYFSNQFDASLTLSNIKTDFDYGSGEEATLKIIHSFDKLSQELRNIEGLPLIISSVRGISSVLRFTDVYPNLATSFEFDETAIKRNNILLTKNNLNAVPHFVQPIEGIIQLSMSGKWPNDLEAVKHLKSAFFLRISESLSQKYLIKSNAWPDYLDIYKNGFIFRFYISHQKEIALLKKTINADGAVAYRDTEESLALEKHILNLPQITGSLHGLHTQYPSFGGACRIAKRWIRSQLLDESHMPSVALELLVASLFTSPEPYTVPSTPQCAFLRLLECLAFTDWQTDPIVVNLNNELNKEQVTEIETYFAQNRQTLQPLFIATPYDLNNSIWTKSNPSVQVLSRISLLAKEALQFIENKLFGSEIINTKVLFRPLLSGYDALIHLKPSLNPLSFQSIDKKVHFELKPYKHKKNEKIPVVKFNPVQIYLDELRKHFGEYALFFHDSYGGNIIGVLWKPAVKEVRDFKVSQINGRSLIHDKNVMKLVLNTEALMEDFYTIGQDLVLSIDIK